MGQIFYKITVDQIEKTIEALTGAIAGMSEAMGKMQDAGMGEAYFPSLRRFDGGILTLASTAVNLFLGNEF